MTSTLLLFVSVPSVWGFVTLMKKCELIGIVHVTLLLWDVFLPDWIGQSALNRDENCAQSSLSSGQQPPRERHANNVLCCFTVIKSSNDDHVWKSNPEWQHGNVMFSKKYIFSNKSRSTAGADEVQVFQLEHEKSGACLMVIIISDELSVAKSKACY